MSHKVLYNVADPSKRTPRLSDIFWQEATKSQRIVIAVGYVGESSLEALSRFLLENQDIKLTLYIGMHGKEGFSHGQLKGVERLNKLLVSSNRGGVYVLNRVRYHGKLYWFTSDENGLNSIYIGSANLDAIVKDYKATWEVGLLLPSGDPELVNHIQQDIAPQGTRVDYLKIEPTVEDTAPLETFPEARKLKGSRLENELQAILDLDGLDSDLNWHHFRLPLKAEPKSNLNAFNGKGRENKATGRIIPRPWYEVEIIVPQQLRGKTGYPVVGETFSVVTEDEWLFECEVNGDGGKNFRSAHNLSVLGAWIKGKMQERGCLEVGGLVTEETLRNFGTSALSFWYNPSKSLGYLSFAYD